MKTMMMIATMAIYIFIGNNAYADRIDNPKQLQSIIEKCDANYRVMTDDVRSLNARIHENSFEYNTEGTITYESTMVWRRDIKMLMSFMEIDWARVTHDTGMTVERCNSVLIFYSGCVDELVANVLAKVSVRRPTTGCLGKLYDRYAPTKDDWVHGR